jgi:putative phosphoribosyl transferase
MFVNRKEGGEKLGKALAHYRDKNIVVVGIPRGGVETAYYVARYLQAPLSMVITRKLGYPDSPETAFGAIAEDGSVFVFNDAGVSDETIARVVEIEKREIARRIKALRGGKPFAAIKGKTVVIVDDGIATGATLFATIKMCKKMEAKKIVVAAPVGGEWARKRLSNMVDDVVILLTPPFFHAVSQGYYSFENLADEEVLEIWKQWENEQELLHS